MGKMKEYIRRCNRLYIIARCLMNINDSNLVKLIKGYYETSYEFTSVLAVHNGEKYPNEMIYYINFYVSRDKKNIKGDAGFCAILRWTLQCLSFPDFLELTPVVEWGRDSAYYDADMDSVTTNVFEYYFKPVSQIDYMDIKNCKNVIEAQSTANSFFFMKRASDMPASYRVEETEIEKLGYLYKKYIHLNGKTEEYIRENLNGILKNWRILAVHVRGTDYDLGLKNHPKKIDAEEYLAKTRNIYSLGRYDKVFLATDDVNALELFEHEFKDKLLYYKDVFRTENHTGPHNTPNGRPLHYYKLGLEVLRDVYTLANCDSLVCGLSQVSFAARYVNIALKKKFKEVVILDNGINMEDSAEARKLKRYRQRMSRMYKHI